MMDYEELEQFVKWCYKKQNISEYFKNMFKGLDEFISKEIEIVENANVCTKLMINYDGKITLYEQLPIESPSLVGYFHNKKGCYLSDLSRYEFYQSFIQWLQKEKPEIYSKQIVSLVNNVMLSRDFLN